MGARSSQEKKTIAVAQSGAGLGLEGGAEGGGVGGCRRSNEPHEG